jgi:GT2 family glycosyltransferase
VRLSVIVLNWNGRAWLERCIPTLLAEGTPEVRIYVADNGSSDQSVEFLHGRWPQLRVVANGRNLRFAGGNNAAAQVALGDGCDVLLFLNNDTEVLPNAFTPLMLRFAREPRLGVLGPRVTYLERPERIWFGGGNARPAWAWFAHRAIRKRVDAGADPAGETDWVSGCALAVRGELYLQLGGLDESFYIYGEDVDFCLRAKALGWRVGYEPMAEIRHAVSASVGGRRSAFKLYHQARSRRQLVERHVAPRRRLGALALAAAQSFAFGALALLRGDAVAAAAAVNGHRDLTRGINRYPVT